MRLPPLWLVVQALLVAVMVGADYRGAWFFVAYGLLCANIGFALGLRRSSRATRAASC